MRKEGGNLGQQLDKIDQYKKTPEVHNRSSGVFIFCDICVFIF